MSASCIIISDDEEDKELVIGSFQDSDDEFCDVVSRLQKKKTSSNTGPSKAVKTGFGYPFKRKLDSSAEDGSRHIKLPRSQTKMSPNFRQMLSQKRTSPNIKQVLLQKSSRKTQPPPDSDSDDLPDLVVKQQPRVVAAATDDKMINTSSQAKLTPRCPRLSRTFMKKYAASQTSNALIVNESSKDTCKSSSSSSTQPKSNPKFNKHSKTSPVLGELVRKVTGSTDARVSDDDVTVIAESSSLSSDDEDNINVPSKPAAAGSGSYSQPCKLRTLYDHIKKKNGLEEQVAVLDHPVDKRNILQDTGKVSSRTDNPKTEDQSDLNLLSYSDSDDDLPIFLAASMKQYNAEYLEKCIKQKAQELERSTTYISSDESTTDETLELPSQDICIPSTYDESGKTLMATAQTAQPLQTDNYQDMLHVLENSISSEEDTPIPPSQNFPVSQKRTIPYQQTSSNSSSPKRGPHSKLVIDMKQTRDMFAPALKRLNLSFVFRSSDSNQSTSTHKETSIKHNVQTGKKLPSALSPVILLKDVVKSPEAVKYLTQSKRQTDDLPKFEEMTNQPSVLTRPQQVDGISDDDMTQDLDPSMTNQPDVMNQPQQDNGISDDDMTQDLDLSMTNQPDVMTQRQQDNGISDDDMTQDLDPSMTNQPDVMTQQQQDNGISDDDMTQDLDPSMTNQPDVMNQRQQDNGISDDDMTQDLDPSMTNQPDVMTQQGDGISDDDMTQYLDPKLSDGGRTQTLNIISKRFPNILSSVIILEDVLKSQSAQVYLDRNNSPDIFDNGPQPKSSASPVEEIKTNNMESEDLFATEDFGRVGSDDEASFLREMTQTRKADAQGDADVEIDADDLSDRDREKAEKDITNDTGNFSILDDIVCLDSDDDDMFANLTQVNVSMDEDDKDVLANDQHFEDDDDVILLEDDLVTFDLNKVKQEMSVSWWDEDVFSQQVVEPKHDTNEEEMDTEDVINDARQPVIDTDEDLTLQTASIDSHVAQTVTLTTQLKKAIEVSKTVTGDVNAGSTSKADSDEALNSTSKDTNSKDMAKTAEILPDSSNTDVQEGDETMDTEDVSGFRKSRVRPLIETSDDDLSDNELMQSVINYEEFQKMQDQTPIPMPQPKPSFTHKIITRACTVNAATDPDFEVTHRQTPSSCKRNVSISNRLSKKAIQIDVPQRKMSTGTCCSSGGRKLQVNPISNDKFYGNSKDAVTVTDRDEYQPVTIVPHRGKQRKGKERKVSYLGKERKVGKVGSRKGTDGFSLTQAVANARATMASRQQKVKDNKEELPPLYFHTKHEEKEVELEGYSTEHVKLKHRTTHYLSSECKDDAASSGMGVKVVPSLVTQVLSSSKKSDKKSSSKSDCKNSKASSSKLDREMRSSSSSSKSDSNNKKSSSSSSSSKDRNRKVPKEGSSKSDYREKSKTSKDSRTAKSKSLDDAKQEVTDAKKNKIKLNARHRSSSSRSSRESSTDKTVPEMSLLSQIIRDQDDLLTHEIELPSLSSTMDKLSTTKASTVDKPPSANVSHSTSVDKPSSVKPGHPATTKKQICDKSSDKISDGKKIPVFTIIKDIKQRLAQHAIASVSVPVHAVPPPVPPVPQSCDTFALPMPPQFVHPQQNNNMRPPQLCDMINRQNMQKTANAQGKGPSATSVKLTEDSVLRMILSWHPQWLQEQAKFGGKSKPPPILDVVQNKELYGDERPRLFPLLTHGYDSLVDYLKITLPLLLYEVWAQIFNSYYEKRRKSGCLPSFQAVLCQMLDKNENVYEVMFQAILTRQEVMEKKKPTEGSLMILFMKMVSDVTGKLDGVGLLALVTKVQLSQKCHPALESHPAFKEPGMTIWNIAVKLSHRKNIRFEDNQTANFELLDSMVTTQRHIKALINLSQIPSCMCRAFLRPSSDRKTFHHSPRPGAQLHISKGQYNASQSEVILSVADAILQPYIIPKICLIQGPPGTGKSHTILGIIKETLRGKPAEGGKVHILLTAPSNAAVDELVKKLVKDDERAVKMGTQKRINFIRIGSLSHPAVKEYSLESKVQKLAEQKLQMQNLPLSAQEELKKISQTLEELKIRKQNAVQAEINACQREEKNLRKKKDQIEEAYRPRQRQQLTYGEQRELERQLLNLCDVVCTTLNSSGLRILTDLNNTNPRYPFFNAIIVDEACQATEIDNIIPLQFKSTKLVLVGDPNQLPATVLSSVAENYDFNQSLFERFEKSFLRDSPVMMLDTQYRMHPDICQFPSQHIYAGKLKTDLLTASQRESMQYKSYKVFDLVDSQEVSSDFGFWNPAELEFVCRLCRFLTQGKPDSYMQAIGIITPYQAQRVKLHRALSERGMKIEPTTVDGFQGREKDIIIMTCVRANSDNGGIGFLNDVRRMNVALTRARYALYIVGHLKSLRVNRDWRSLIEDAHRRNVIAKVTKTMDANLVLQKEIVKTNK